MALIRRFVMRLINALRPGRAEPDLARELETHLALLSEEFQRRGLAPHEARQAASRRLGSVEHAKDLHRDARSFAWLDALNQDIRSAARALRRQPGFASVTVLILALAVGGNIAVFAVTNAVLFRGFRAIDRSNRLVYIGTQRGVSYPDFEDWRLQATSFDALGAVGDLQILVADSSGAPEHYVATQVTANAFALVGKTPILGRDFSAADEKPGAVAVTILSHRFWQRRYAGNENIVGRVIRINGTPTTVIGVMPQGFAFPQNQDLWVPLIPTPELRIRSNRSLWFAFGRLPDSVTFDSARRELALIGRRLATVYPQTNEGLVPAPRTFAEFFLGIDAALIYSSLWGAATFVLFIACANAANLQLAHAIGRSREVSIRMALGAGRSRIVRQLILESLMISSVGGALGWWLAKWSIRIYEATANPPTRSWSEGLLDYTLDARVFAYALAISIGTGVLFGLAAAIRLTGADIGASLKESGRSATTGPRRKGLHRMLVVGQLALSLMLLAGAGVLVRSFMNLHAADLGVEAEGILTGFMSLRDRAYQEAPARLAFFDRLDAGLQALPGVESAAIASNYPGGGMARLRYEVDGGRQVDPQSRATTPALIVGAEYFKTVRAAMLSGREFTDADGPSEPSVAIVNDQFARTHWPGEDPLGKRLRLFDRDTPGEWLTVVGVASTIVQDVARQRREPIVYVPYRQEPVEDMWVLIRTLVVPGSLARAFRGEVQAIDADLPIWLGPYPLSERLAGTGTYWNVRKDAALLLIFACIGLLLASIGLYALMAHSVGQQTQEIGIRTAMGATPRDILALVLRQGMVPLGTGISVGLVGAFFVTPVLKSQLIEVSAVDPTTLVVASSVLAVSGVLGCALPARRAVSVDPVVALRHN